MTRLRGTNFCSNSARFALSFVRQPNRPKCIQIVQNTPKHEFRVQWSGSGAFTEKNSDVTSCTNFCTTLARFAPSFERQPNGTKCTQIVRNAPKHEFRSQQGQSGVFIAKNFDATSWHELLHQLGPFCTKFCKATKCIQIVQNTPKYVFRVQWGGLGVFIVKNYDATWWHELLH